MGTLAIMGILALAGIWMYNSAMDRLKANTIINEAQKRAVVVAGQIGFQGRTDPSLGEFSDNTFAGGTFSTDVVTSGLYEQFGIQVSNVPKRICQNILNSIGATTPIRRLAAPGNPTTALTSCTDTNNFSIIYNNDMSSGGNDTTYATTDCSCQTVCGVCVVENGENKCVNECPSNQNTCSSNADCSGECVGCVILSGQSTGTCQSCQKVAYLEATGTQYIDTGSVLSSTSRVECEAEYTGTPVSAYFFGTYANNLNFGLNSSSNRWYGVWKAEAVLSSPSIPAAINTKYHAIMDSNGIYINGALLSSVSGAFTGTRTAYMFWANGTSKAKSLLKMYYLKIWNNSQLVRDFIPIHAPFKTDGKQNCMYDKVSKTLFCNAATGDFVTDLSP